jgi:protein-disulfide isomerase
MPPQASPSPAPQQSLGVPLAIVIAGALVAAALYFGGYGQTAGTNNPGTAQAKKDVPKVVATEHILGNPNAPIKIVEYTDLECPFCKQFHGTMKQVMDKYGKDGQVAWVLRNFPLAQLHPNAPKLALAAECVAELGGNSVYWKFLDAVFVSAPINTFFDFTKLDSVVASVGVDTAAFEACYQSNKYQDKITKEFNDAVASGGQGTPFNILVDKKGKNIEIKGSQPFEVVVATIEAALK